MKQENEKKQKSSYHAPKLKVLGNLIDNTLGSAIGTNDAKGSTSTGGKS